MKPGAWLQRRLARCPGCRCQTVIVRGKGRKVLARRHTGTGDWPRECTA